jgi:hypothetical protein
MLNGPTSSQRAHTPHEISGSSSSPETFGPPESQPFDLAIGIRKVRGGILAGVGYLLSPLCWWNDLVFNLPVAYAFGWLVGQMSHDWFVPGIAVGYWLSNVVGIVMMQFGATDLLQGRSPHRNWRKDLWFGLASSTVYTLVVLALVQFGASDWIEAVLGAEAWENMTSLLYDLK